MDNPAFYDSETGLCSKVDPKKKQNSWSDNTSYTKRQYNGRLIFLLVAIFILLAVLVAMVTTVVYLAGNFNTFHSGNIVLTSPSGKCLYLNLAQARTFKRYLF